MTASLLSSEADQDRFLLDVYELSRRFARLKVSGDELDDVVQDIALHCLVRLRSRVWTSTPDNISAFVWKLVKNRVADRYRRHERRVASEKEYWTTRERITPEWMSPDRSHDEEVVASLQRRVINELPRRCREVYVLVREEGMTEAEAALLLDISPATAHRHMTIATAKLSKKLHRHGWISRARRADPVAGTKTTAPERAHFAPGYVALPSKTAPQEEATAAVEG